MDEIKFICALIKNVFEKGSGLLLFFSIFFLIISFTLTYYSKNGERFYLNKFDILCLKWIFISLFIKILIFIL